MGDLIGERFFSLSTYCLAGAGIVTNLGDIKSGILFLLGAISLTVQIVFHIMKIRNERKNR